MSRRGIGALALVVVAAVAGSSGSARGSLPPPKDTLPFAKPTLLFGPLAPLTVRGIRFKPRERVTLTLDGGRRGVERVVATRLGGFSATFEIRLLRCRTVTVRATGSQGSRAVRQLPRPNCRDL